MNAKNRKNSKLNPGYRASVRCLEKVVIFGQEHARIKRIWKRNIAVMLFFRFEETSEIGANETEKSRGRRGGGGGRGKKERPEKRVEGKGGKCSGVRTRAGQCDAQKGENTDEIS